MYFEKGFQSSVFFRKSKKCFVYKSSKVPLLWSNSSIFLYCLLVVSCTSSRNLNALALKQKQCIRFISNSKYNAHTAPLFSELRILPLPDLISQHIYSFMHSIEYCYNELHFQDIFQRNSEVGTQNVVLRNSNDFYLPRIRLEFLKRFPFSRLSFFRIQQCLEQMHSRQKRMLCAKFENSIL